MKMKLRFLVIAMTVIFLTAAFAAKKIFFETPAPKHSDLFLQEKKRRRDLVEKESEREQRTIIQKKRKLLRN